MPPRFSLQPVLDYRHNLVESLQIELGQVTARKQQAENDLQTLCAFRAQLFAELERQQQGVIDFEANRQTRINLRVIEERIQEQIELVRTLERKVAEKQAEVISARQDEETLATLKRKELERYQLEQAALENRLQDDIYIARAYRMLGHGGAS